MDNFFATIHKLKKTKIPSRDFPLPLEEQFKVIRDEDEKELDRMWKELQIKPTPKQIEDNNFINSI